MELRVLSYFLDIAREGNFTRAAAQLHLNVGRILRPLRLGRNARFTSLS